jgi:hypothetical protein
MTKSPLANLIKLAMIMFAGARGNRRQRRESQNEIRLPRQAIQNAHQSRAGERHGSVTYAPLAAAAPAIDRRSIDVTISARNTI